MVATQIEQRQWWVDRWLELLDSYRFKKRLERARNYAREGNVLSLQFVESKLTALVQGTEVDPYQVTLGLDCFSDEDWHYVVATLAEQALYAAQLLSGAMPPSIEQVFVQNGLNLFPFTLGEVHSRCSCPDKANPCKHIGAVYYQLADHFQEDPFVIFRLRGRSRGELLEQLSCYRHLSPAQLASYDPDLCNDSTAIAIDIEEGATTAKPQKQTKAEQQQAIEQFWQYRGELAPELTAIAPPDNPMQQIERLGDLPLNYEVAREIKQALTQIYQASSQATLGQMMGAGD
ncbi:SWIM zinc finger family protein [Synechocystis sp. PCC 7339]|uniref:SWIM zinc finger family protein n=1 Tax=unclassified Synechocystis TaxID=2640012 RepID=UPI001BAEDAA5|nr:MULTISPECIES: SWIM zinc finger family protein [unclassified Synechocystis]QUS60739.1 SWIM zinc finger family protein [Synechocystis sp. PCC 7338]UAJ72925.1 SWIM zinc finger family protein [Synechocystis sp. PCC 7339]